MVVFNDQNKPRVVVGESAVGGIVAAIDDRSKQVIIGHEQPKQGVRWAGMFTIAEGGKLKRLGSHFDETIDPQKNDADKEPMK